MRNIIINQSSGIGDILFLEPMLRHLSKYKKVIFPVEDYFLWIQKHIPYVSFVPKSKYHIDYTDMVMTDEYLPLRYANQILRGLDRHDHHDQENTMLDKYRLLGLHDDMWLSMDFVRDYKSERELFNKLECRYEYNLINNQSRAGDTDIKKDGVFMRPIEGHSLLDWAMVMERAKENHHVSTSTFYMMVWLNLDNCFVYPRPDIYGLQGIKQLLPYTKVTPIDGMS
jgi:hypothetical protein